MKRLLPLFLALLLLTGCAVPAEQQNAPQDGPSATEPQTNPDVSTEPSFPFHPDPQPQPDAPPPPITAESLRAEYEAQGLTVREIISYDGDFLVYCGGSPVDGAFQWVYADTGLRAPPLYSNCEILDYEIRNTGYIQVLTGGENLHNAYRYFPTYQHATAVLPLTHNGSPLDQEYFGNGKVQKGTYWAPLSKSYPFGWEGRPTALVDVQVNANGVDAVFGPQANELGNFFAAVSSIPLVTPTYDEAAHALTLRFHDTALNSGDRTEFADEFDRRSYETIKEDYHLPTNFPAGPVNGSNDFVRSAEVRTDGDDTLLILALTETAQAYTAETGQLLTNESRPYLRLSLRDAWDY